MSMNAAPRVTRIDPANWYVGMKNPSLQLMLYGKDISTAEVQVDCPGVSIDSIVRPESPNYLIVYLNLSGAQAGEMTLKVGKQKLSYPLKNREMSGEKRMGFTNKDVLYMLMPDRFAQGANHPAQVKGLNTYVEDRTQPSLRHGGDLEGIREHLDYFNELGVTALWLTPVLENNSPDSKSHQSTYHGYATTDYYRVDPRFGTNEQYKQLIDEAHQRGLKVVMDMIFNHCGFEHPWVKDMPQPDWFNTPEWLNEPGAFETGPVSQGENTTNEASAYLQTSYKLTPVLDPYRSDIDLHETVDGWFVPSMPDLNQRNPHVMTYLIQNSIWWIETVGIDGIRMDTYPYADRQGMARWMKELEQEYPNFNTVGETWVTEPAYTAAWQKNSKLSETDSYLKTVMDFAFFDKLNQAKHEETDDWWRGFNRIYNSLVYDYLYENPKSVLAFIDNHDTDRFLGETKDSTMLKQALALLLTAPRIPQIYYGTEILMNGTKAITDGNVRKDFPGGFPGDERNAFTAEGRTKAEQGMFQWLSTLLHYRQSNNIISDGAMKQFIPMKGIYVIARQLDGKTLLTILNGKRAENELQVKRYAEVIGSHTQAKDIITSATVDLTQNITLPQRAVLMLEF